MDKENTNTTKPQSLSDMYIATLTEKEYQGYLIARSHLGSSFNLEKSLGFIEWARQRPIITESSTPCNP